MKLSQLLIILFCGTAFTVEAQPAAYDSISPYNLANNKLARVWKDKKAGLANKKGMLITPIEYTGIFAFYDGFSIVEKKSSGTYAYGVINTKGKVVIPVIYDSYAAEAISEDGFFIFEKDGKQGMLNKKGEIVIPFNYDIISPNSAGIYYVKKAGKYGLVNNKGKIIIPVMYDNIAIDKKVITARQSDYTEYYFNIKGKPILNPYTTKK